MSQQSILSCDDLTQSLNIARSHHLVDHRFFSPGREINTETRIVLAEEVSIPPKLRESRDESELL
jgi:hypothetical protein